MELELRDYWTLAAILIGFQLTAFAWRVSREIAMAERQERTWFPLADIINVLGISIAAFGVFLLPMSGVTNLDVPRDALGVDTLFMAAYPWALAGHYNLLWPPDSTSARPYATVQEMAIVAATACAALAFLVVATWRG